MPYSLCLYDDSFLPGLRRLVDAIHSCGAKVAVQLMHPGLLLLLLRSIPEGMTVKVPSEISWLRKDLPYREVDEREIEGYIGDFAEAAVRVKKSGADAVELHACHGCLVSTFLSPATNRREDRYGESVENRVRFARRIVEGMREAVEEDYPILVRINGADGVAGGVKEEEAVEQASLLYEAGADGISVSAGLEYWSSIMAPCSLSPDGPNVAVAEAVKKKIDSPVIVAGKIPPEAAAETVKDGKADFIALGRPLLADPELPRKLREGRQEEICPCLYCNNCMRSKWRSCTVNPFLYREEKAQVAPAEQEKRIMVVGGGVAGMQASAILGRKGHQVSLYEKEKQLGGQWLAAAGLPGRERFFLFLDYLKRQQAAGGVEVVLGRRIGREEILREKPDILVAATGGVPRLSPWPGEKGCSMLQAVDVIQRFGEKPTENGFLGEPGAAIVVVGGSMTSMEVAVMLHDRGYGVALVSSGKLGGRHGPEERITFRAVMDRLLSEKIPVHEGIDISGFSENGVVILREGEPYLVPCDYVVLSLGTDADDGLIRELEGETLEVYSVGDCVQPGTAAQATYSAASVALRI
jgi:2,4-dienoyl-CoA reductase-like NADH-dependent reductase (Old Yellow Enzyme family)/thioredoxin reductase